MESIWAILELLLISAVVLAFGLSAAIVFETFRRRFNHTHVEAPPVFEDPTSFKPVPCPHIFDPAEKYISLVIPAYDEEHRIAGALEETLNYLQQCAANNSTFTYERKWYRYFLMIGFHIVVLLAVGSGICDTQELNPDRRFELTLHSTRLLEYYEFHYQQPREPQHGNLSSGNCSIIFSET